MPNARMSWSEPGKGSWGRCGIPVRGDTVYRGLGGKGSRQGSNVQSSGRGGGCMVMVRNLNFSLRAMGNIEGF